MINREILKSKYISLGKFISKNENEKPGYKSYNITNYKIRKPKRIKGKGKSYDQLNQKLSLNISTDYFDIKKQAYRNLYRKQLNINNFNLYRANKQLNIKKQKSDIASNFSFSSNPVKRANLHEILQQAKKYILTDNNSVIGSHRRELLSLNSNPIFKKNIISKPEKMNFSHDLSPYDSILSRSNKKNEYKLHNRSVDFISHKLFLINERRKRVNENQKNILEKKKKIVEAKNMKEKISFLNKTYEYLYPKYEDIDDEETYGIIPYLIQEKKYPKYQKEEEKKEKVQVNEDLNQLKSINIFIQN